MQTVDTDETSTLIASNKVEGTAVYTPDGERLGSIYNFMVDKRTGQVSYAVLQFGGFLGLGADYYPLGWNQLKYDTDLGGYIVGVPKEAFADGPRFATADAVVFQPA